MATELQDGQHSNQEVCIFETVVFQAGLELVDSNNPPASACK